MVDSLRFLTPWLFDLYYSISILGPCDMGGGGVGIISDSIQYSPYTVIR